MVSKSLPSDCQLCDYLKDGDCTDKYFDRLCLPHVEGKEPSNSGKRMEDTK